MEKGMNRFTKTISIILCLALLVNVIGLEVSASSGTETIVSDAEKSGTDADKTVQPQQDDISGGTVSDEDPATKKEGTESAESGKTTENADVKTDEGTGEKTVEGTDDAAKPEAVENQKEFNQEKTYITNLMSEKKDEHSVELRWEVKDEAVIDGFDIALYEDKDLNIDAKGVTISADTENAEVEDTTEVHAEEAADVADAAQRTVGKEKTAVVLSGLETGKTYYAAVSAYSMQGKKKLASASVSEEVKIAEDPVTETETEEWSVTKVENKDASAVISWQTVTDAESYKIIDASDKSKIIREGIPGESVSYEITGLTNGASYSYRLCAVKSGDIESVSAPFTLSPRALKPATVTGLSATGEEQCIILTWSNAENATAYYVERYDDGQRAWVRVANTTSNCFTNTGLSKGATYQFRVYSVRTSAGETVVGDVSAVVSGKVPDSVGSVQSMHYSARMKRKAAAYATKSGKGKVMTLKGGAKVTVIDSAKKRYLVQTSSGKTGWVAKSAVRLRGSVVTKKDYTTSVKTAYVNSRGYKSKTPYLLWLSHYTQRLYIFHGSRGNWKLIRTCRVSTGKFNMQTPKGILKIRKKTNGWKKRSYYVRPAVEFSPGIWFHSRLKKYKGGLYDGTIGRPASHGCVRLLDNDINFVRQQIPLKTTVVSF